MKQKSILLALGVSSIIGCAENTPDNTTMLLAGNIYVKGSSPHTYLVIEDQATHRNYKIQNPEAFNLTQKQNEYVKLQVQFLQKAKGPGAPTLVKALSISN